MLLLLLNIVFQTTNPPTPICLCVQGGDGDVALLAKNLAALRRKRAREEQEAAREEAAAAKVGHCYCVAAATSLYCLPDNQPAHSNVFVCAGGCEEAGGAEEVMGKGGGGGDRKRRKLLQQAGGTVGVGSSCTNIVRVTVVVVFVVVSFLTKRNPIHSITCNHYYFFRHQNALLASI